jgi:hypothetical protein
MVTVSELLNGTERFSGPALPLASSVSMHSGSVNDQAGAG